jgi:hypothetical protein
MSESVKVRCAGVATNMCSIKLDECCVAKNVCKEILIIFMVSNPNSISVCQECYNKQLSKGIWKN